MGADGHIVIVKRSDWDANFPDVEPRAGCGLYTGMMIGVEAVWSYFGEPSYEMDIGWNAITERQKEAVAWFKTNAETHEVWT